MALRLTYGGVDIGADAARLSAGLPARRVLRRPVLLRLHQAGKLPRPALMAGTEIARVYEGVCRSLFPRGGLTQVYASRAPAGTGEAHMPAALAASVARYERWAMWAREQAVGSAGVSVVDLAFDVAVDNLGLSQVGARRQLHAQTVLSHLDRGLGEYARLAGWLLREAA